MLYRAPELGEAELAALARIDEELAALRTALSEPRRWSGDLKRLALIGAVHSSAEIEGYPSTLDQTAAVIDGREACDVDDETAQALRGYHDAMTFVVQLADDRETPLYTTHLIRAFQFLLTSFDPKAGPGRWRNGPIHVPGARGMVAFTAPEADLIPDLMAELVDWLNQEDGNPHIRAAIAHLNIARIHPFRQGNHGAARLLQDLVLGRGAAVPPLFLGVEEYLGAHVAAYNTALASAGASYEPDTNTRPWLQFMLQAHAAQAAAYRQGLLDYDRLWLDLMGLTGAAEDDRTLVALMDAALGLRVTRSSYQGLLEREGRPVAPRSAARDLFALVDKGWLTPIGDNRARVYVAAATVVNLWHRIVEG